MRNMIIIIIILLVIFVGMFIYKNNFSNSANNITINEVQEIEKYISKIYMWKEVTKVALPTFDDINNADDLWIWEVVKKNLEEYEVDYQNIQNMLKGIFGENIKKELPKEGNSSFTYDRESEKYISSGINLDSKEDKFLINKIEKENNEYRVEIIEYLEDYSENNSEDGSEIEDLEQDIEYDIIIRNLEETEIARIKNTESQTNVNEFIKSNIDSFSKKELIIRKDNEERLYVYSIMKEVSETE